MTRNSIVCVALNLDWARAQLRHKLTHSERRPVAYSGTYMYGWDEDDNDDRLKCNAVQNY